MSSIDLLRFTLAQKNLATALLLLAKQRFPNSPEAQLFSNQPQEDIGASPSHSTASLTKIPHLASLSALQFPAISL